MKASRLAVRTIVLEPGKETEKKLRWEMDAGLEAPFELYIEKWRVPGEGPEEWPGRIRVSVRNFMVSHPHTWHSTDSSRYAKDPCSIVWVFKQEQIMGHSVRYAPLHEDQCPMGKPYIPNDFHADLGEYVEVRVEWDFSTKWSQFTTNVRRYTQDEGE